MSYCYYNYSQFNIKAKKKDCECISMAITGLVLLAAFFVVMTKYKKQWKGGRALLGIWSKEIHSIIEKEARWQKQEAIA